MVTGGRGAYAAIECIGGEIFAQVGSPFCSVPSRGWRGSPAEEAAAAAAAWRACRLAAAQLRCSGAAPTGGAPADGTALRRQRLGACSLLSFRHISAQLESGLVAGEPKLPRQANLISSAPFPAPQVCGAVRDNGSVLIYGAMSGLTATYA